jgi:hypothetical protein
VIELANALGDGREPDAVSECLDVANFAMMVADQLHGLAAVDAPATTPSREAVLDDLDPMRCGHCDLPLYAHGEARVRECLEALSAPAPAVGSGEALPCPCCGGKAELYGGGEASPWYRVGCNGVFVKRAGYVGGRTIEKQCVSLCRGFDTPEEALAVWNRRAAPPAPSREEAGR